MKLILILSNLLLLLSQGASEVKWNNVVDWSTAITDLSHDIFSTHCLDGDNTKNNNNRSLRNVRSLSQGIRRKLNDDLIPCDSIIEVMPLATVQAMVAQAFAYKGATYTAGPPLVEAQFMIEERIPLMEHDVQMMKVCGSCESEGLNGFGCEVDDYGYDTRHSGILLLPVYIDEEGSTIEASIIDTADELQTWIGMRSIVLSQRDSEFLLYTVGATVLEYAMFAASMGLISILPHLMGYGESAKAGSGGPLIPSIVEKKSKTTAVLPLYAKSKSIVDEMSGGMTTVGNEAYFMGYSEGGNSAVGAADGFEKNGIAPIKVMAGSAPLMIRSTSILSILKSFLAGELAPHQTLYQAMVGMAFSDTRPGPANFEQGQPFLNTNLTESYIALFTDKDAPSISGDGGEMYFTYLQTNYQELFTSDFLSSNYLRFFLRAIQNEDPDPCVNLPVEQQVIFEVDKICATLNENDLTDVVKNASYELELCQAENDTLIVPESVPDASKLKYIVPGSHSEGNNPCTVKFIYGTIFEKPEIREENISSPKSPKIAKATKSGRKSKVPKTPKMGKKLKGSD